MAAKETKPEQGSAAGVALLLKRQNKTTQSLLRKALNIYVSSAQQDKTEDQKSDELRKAIEESI